MVCWSDLFWILSLVLLLSFLHIQDKAIATQQKGPRGKEFVEGVLLVYRLTLLLHTDSHCPVDSNSVLMTQKPHHIRYIDSEFSRGLIQLISLNGLT